MSIELKLTIKDDGTIVVKQFKDSTVKAMKEAENAVDGVSKKTDEFGRKHKSTYTSAIDDIKKFKSNYLAMAGAIGTVTAIGAAIVHTANKTAQYIEQVTDLADATGISTKTIQVFGEAAKISGESVEDAAMSINMFYRQLGAARSGSKDTLQSFENLGVKVRDANGAFKSGEEILLATVERLSLIGDKSDRAAYLQDLFGRSGIKMSETIDRLARQYDPLVQRLDRFNMLIDDEKRAQVEKYLEVTREWKTAWEGFSQAIGQKVLPVLSDLTKFGTFLVAGPEKMMAPPEIKRPPPGLSGSKLKDWMQANYKAPAEVIAPKPFEFGREGDKAAKGAGAGKGKTEFEAQAALNKLQESMDKKSLDYLKKIEADKIEFQKKLDKEDQELHDKKLKRAEEWMDWVNETALAEQEITRSKEDSYLQMGDSIISVLSIMAGKSKEWLMVYKGAAIIETTISAIVSGQRAFENTLSSPVAKLLGPLAIPAAIAARIAAYAQGIAQVAMISSQSFQTGGVLLRGPRAYGSNEVWYKGTPGEGVLTREGVENVGGARGINRLNRGRGMGGNNVTVNVNADRFDEDFVRRKLVPTISKVNSRLRA